LAHEVQICVKDCAETDEGGGNNEMVYTHPSHAYLDYCLPFPKGGASVQVNVTLTGDFKEWWNDYGKTFWRASGDVLLCLEVIAFSTLVALILSYAYIELLNYVAGYLILFCTLLIGVAGVVLGHAMFTYSKDVAANSYMAEERSDFLEYGAYTVWTLTGLFLLIMLFLRTQIRIAIEVVKEAARALSDMKLLMFTPVVPLVVTIGYACLWLYIGLAVFSVSELRHEPMPYLIEEHDGEQTAYYNRTLSIYRITPDQIYASVSIHLFHGLWTLQFSFYLLYSVIAGAVASWYFTPRDDNGDKLIGGAEGLPSSPIWQSFCRVCRYHIGTIALASLIIAIIQTLRAFVHYMEKKLKNGGNPSTVATALLKMLQCCLWCVECCMDKINKNGLVWTAIYGDSFCVATCSSFALIWRNLARLAAINTVSTILLTIGKVCIALANMCLFGLTLEYSFLGDQLFSVYGPALVIFILSYLVARMFMAMFEVLIDATFFCFLVDVENNDYGMMLAHKNLQKLVGKYKKESKKQARLAKMDVYGNSQTRNSDSKDQEIELEERSNPAKEKKKKSQDDFKSNDLDE